MLLQTALLAGQGSLDFRFNYRPLATIKPGAWSIDTRFFGRKHIDFGDLRGRFSPITGGPRDLDVGTPLAGLKGENAFPQEGVGGGKKLLHNQFKCEFERNGRAFRNG